MIYPEFIANLIKYYGPYDNDTVEQLVFLYIQKKFKESDLENVLLTITQNHTNKFKTKDRGCPPDIAIIQTIFDSPARQETKAMVAWDKVKKGSSMDTVFFDDVTIHAVIEQLWGNWLNFTKHRDTEKNEWVRKDFIKTYILLSKVDCKVHKPLLGYGDIHCTKGHEASKKYGIKMIGNEERCKLLLEQYNKVNKEIDFDYCPKINNISDDK